MEDRNYVTGKDETNIYSLKHLCEAGLKKLHTGNILCTANLPVGAVPFVYLPLYVSC